MISNMDWADRNIIAARMLFEPTNRESFSDVRN
jgi:hypothetical protein